jgi:small subunit ribosomal protein S1
MVQIIDTLINIATHLPPYITLTHTRFTATLPPLLINPSPAWIPLSLVLGGHLPDFFRMTTQTNSEFEQLLADGEYLNIPQVGDVVEGTVVGSGRREIRIDLGGVATGVVRGRELFAESSEYAGLKTGEKIEATVIDLENENGELELSFRFAGQQRAWEEIRRLFTTGEAVETKIVEANKGGLIVSIQHITGFLPVSQLSPDHYPRVSGGDKTKILEKLKSYIGMGMSVRVLDANESDEKLIVSEKAVWEDKQQNVLSSYAIGSVVEGEVTALADFGAFVKFDSLEGLVHISEIAWQRIDHPRDLLKIGQMVKASVIGIEGSKIFLSMKKLIADPWDNVGEKYNAGDIVEGIILKVNPFGFFVELDNEIHGLAHVSELSDSPVTDVHQIGKEGQTMKFKIVSVEPKDHRLGLSLKGMSGENKVVEAQTDAENDETVETDVTEDEVEKTEDVTSTEETAPTEDKPIETETTEEPKEVEADVSEQATETTDKTTDEQSQLETDASEAQKA